MSLTEYVHPGLSLRSVCPSVSPSIYLSVYLSVYLSLFALSPLRGGPTHFPSLRLLAIPRIGNTDDHHPLHHIRIRIKLDFVISSSLTHTQQQQQQKWPSSSISIISNNRNSRYAFPLYYFYRKRFFSRVWWLKPYNRFGTFEICACSHYPRRTISGINKKQRKQSDESFSICYE